MSLSFATRVRGEFSLAVNTGAKMKFNHENRNTKEFAEQLLEYALELARIAEDVTEPASSPGRRAVSENGNALLYAVYAAEDNRSYLAVCLDDPFCYASGPDRESAIKGLLETVREKYGCGHVLDGIEVPDFLPENL